MTALRIVLVLVWIVTQLLGLLVGGSALLGAQFGQPGTAALGVVLLLAPTVLAGGGLLLASYRPGIAGLALGVPLLILVGGAAFLLMSIFAARQS